MNMWDKFWNWVTYPAFYIRRKRMLNRLRKHDPFIYEGDNE